MHGCSQTFCGPSCSQPWTTLLYTSKYREYPLEIWTSVSNAAFFQFLFSLRPNISIHVQILGHIEVKPSEFDLFGPMMSPTPPLPSSVTHNGTAQLQTNFIYNEQDRTMDNREAVVCNGHAMNDNKGMLSYYLVGLALALTLYNKKKTFYTYEILDRILYIKRVTDDHTYRFYLIICKTIVLKYKIFDLWCRVVFERFFWEVVGLIHWEYCFI